MREKFAWKIYRSFQFSLSWLAFLLFRRMSCWWRLRVFLFFVKNDFQEFLTSVAIILSGKKGRVCVDYSAHAVCRFLRNRVKFISNFVISKFKFKCIRVISVKSDLISNLFHINQLSWDLYKFLLLTKIFLPLITLHHWFWMDFIPYEYGKVFWKKDDLSFILQ